MKKPQEPPTFAHLLAECGAERVGEILLSLPVEGLPDAYMHWDEVRRRTPPAGLSTREWWLALKLKRSGQLKSIPLTDVRGQPFRYALPEKVLELLHPVDREACGRIEFSEEVTNPHLRDRYIVSSLMEEAINSSQLEGASTTRRVAKDMLRSGRSPADDSERMIVNNYRVIQEIRRVQRERLTPELVKELHRIATEGTLRNAAYEGHLRRSNDVVVADIEDPVVHQPPPFDQLDERLSKMCAFANQETPGQYIPPVVRAILLHFWLAYDHPFEDGNGRTARALFYWSMLNQGYWLFEFLSISRLIKQAPSKYARSYLYVETDENDATYFLLHQLDVINRALGELRGYLSRKTMELRQTERRLRSVPGLNHRQLALLGHALKHPEVEYSFASHATSHDVVYQTARTDLLELASLGLLVRIKRGKAFVFLPDQGLSERVEELSRRSQSY